MDLFYLTTLWILLSLLFVRNVNGAADRLRIQYSRDALLHLNFLSGADVTDAKIQLPECIRRKPDQNRGLINEKRRKWGNPSAFHDNGEWPIAAK
jgi:hypothetical protein